MKDSRVLFRASVNIYTSDLIRDNNQSFLIIVLIVLIVLSQSTKQEVLEKNHPSLDVGDENKSQQTDLSPPRTIPDYFRDAFTMNGAIPVESFYVDDTNTSAGDSDSRSTHYKFSSASMDVFLRGSGRIHGKIRELIDRLNIPDTSLDMLSNYLPKNQWIMIATLKYLRFSSHEEFQRRGLVGLVVGSMEPWVESWLIHLGFDFVVTSDYNNLTYSHDRIATVSGGCRRMAERYGDEVNPNGDLESMLAVKRLLKPSGMLFLSVPIGPDVLVWNLHRRYGRKRFSKLLEGWSVIGTIGWDESKLDEASDWRRTYEPIFILQRESQHSQSGPLTEDL